MPALRLGMPPAVQARVPPENLLAMYEAVCKGRAYALPSMG